MAAVLVISSGFGLWAASFGFRFFSGFGILISGFGSRVLDLVIKRSRSPGHGPVRSRLITTAVRREDNARGVQNFHLNVKARIWP